MRGKECVWGGGGGTEVNEGERGGNLEEGRREKIGVSGVVVPVQVEVLAGRDKGKQGKIGILDRKRHRVYVQGLNTVSGNSCPFNN